MTWKNSELANSQNFSNIDWDKVGDITKIALGGKGSKKEEEPKPIIKETKILGMHPMTMIVATVSVLIVSIVAIKIIQ